MAIVFEYSNTVDTVYGHKRPSGNDLVIDSVVSRADLNIAVTFAPKLIFVENIFVANYSQEFRTGAHKAPILAYVIARRRSKRHCRVIERELWRDLSWRRRREMAQLFGGKESERLPADLVRGQVRCDWLDDQIYLELTTPLPEGMTCEELETICSGLDQLLNEVWDEVMQLSSGITSPVATIGNRRPSFYAIQARTKCSSVV